MSGIELVSEKPDIFLCHADDISPVKRPEKSFRIKIIKCRIIPSYCFVSSISQKLYIILRIIPFDIYAIGFAVSVISPKVFMLEIAKELAAAYRLYSASVSDTANSAYPDSYST